MDLFASWTQPQYRPDVVLLHIGTNDVWSGRPGNAIAEDLTHLLYRLHGAWPNVTTMVTSILAMPSVKEAYNWGVYNAAMPKIVAQLRNSVRLRVSAGFLSVGSLCIPRAHTTHHHTTTPPHHHTTTPPHYHASTHNTPLTPESDSQRSTVTRTRATAVTVALCRHT